MGNPFSTKKKVEVGTSVQRMVEDDRLPDTAKYSVIKTVLSNDRKASIAENLIKDLSGSLGLKARRLYDWAENNYTYGMPKAYLGSVTQGEDIVKAQISQLIGQTVTFDYFYYAPLNHVHWAWAHLIDVYGYNPLNNNLEYSSAFLGTPVYVQKVVAVYTQATFDESEFHHLDQWYNPAASSSTPEGTVQQVFSTLSQYAATSKFIVDAAATQDTVEVTFFYQNYLTAEGAVSETLVTHESTMILTPPVIESNIRHYQVKYRWLDGVTEKIGYWLYEDESGTYPQIDAIHQNEYSHLGQFYPWIHFRDDKVNLNGPGKAGTPDHVASVKACKYLDLDYAALTDSIHENPDIGDVEQAMLVMGVSANTTHQTGLRYLFQFFTNLADETIEQVNIENTQLDEKLWGNLGRDEKAIIIKDREFALALRFRRIEKRLRAGKIGTGKIGSYALVTGTVDDQVKVTKRDGLGALFEIVETVGQTQSHFYQKQVTTTTYEEVRVFGLALTYFIWKPGTNQEKTFTAWFDADELIVPLDHNIAKGFNLIAREDLYAMSMHMVFNSKIVIKTKWYQQGWFKTVLIIAAIVWAVYSQDWATLSAVLAEQGVQALAMIILEQIVIGYAIQLGLEYLAEIVGAELALILAVAAVAVAGYKSYQAGSIKGAPWAEDLLKLNSGLAKASSTETARQMDKLAGKYEDLVTRAEEYDKEFKRVEDDLRVDTLIDPMEFVALQPMILIAESPEDFFHRTIYGGNVGMQAIDAISSYVKNSLTLPTIRDTLGGEFHGYEGT